MAQDSGEFAALVSSFESSGLSDPFQVSPPLTVGFSVVARVRPRYSYEAKEREGLDGCVAVSSSSRAVHTHSSRRSIRTNSLELQTQSHQCHAVLGEQADEEELQLPLFDRVSRGGVASLIAFGQTVPTDQYSIQ